MSALIDRHAEETLTNGGGFSVPLICPDCRGDLRRVGDERIECVSCGGTFGFEAGFPDLIVGGRFDDPTDEAQMIYEERANQDQTRNFWIPLFRNLFGQSATNRTPTLLSLGCGTGVDVDLLNEEGFNCVGIDCGNRSAVWDRRERKNHLLLANGKHLPFPAATFDGVFCGCVFPHVGVEGDTDRVAARYHDDRLELAREMSRVLKPGGKILVSSPNRLFPFDIFHGRTPGSYRPRPYWPGNPFLLSVADYRRMFRQAGCASARPLSVENYWGFVRSKNSLKGRLLGLPIRFLFKLTSFERFKHLRASPLMPWIVVMVEK